MYLESNVQNIVILLGILIYANNVSFSVTLKTGKRIIRQLKMHKRRCKSSNYYYLAEKGFTKPILATILENAL